MIYVSPETLLRVQKAKATFELKYDVVCCFEGSTNWLGQEREPLVLSLASGYSPSTIHSKQFETAKYVTETGIDWLIMRLWTAQIFRHTVLVVALL